MTVVNADEQWATRRNRDLGIPAIHLIDHV